MGDAKFTAEDIQNLIYDAQFRHFLDCRHSVKHNVPYVPSRYDVYSTRVWCNKAFLLKDGEPTPESHSRISKLLAKFESFKNQHSVDPTNCVPKKASTGQISTSAYSSSAR